MDQPSVMLSQHRPRTAQLRAGGGLGGLSHVLFEARSSSHKSTTGPVQQAWQHRHTSHSSSPLESSSMRLSSHSTRFPSMDREHQSNSAQPRPRSYFECSSIRMCHVQLSCGSDRRSGHVGAGVEYGSLQAGHKRIGTDIHREVLPS